MKIGFDSKRAFHNKTGLGSYSRNVLRILSVHHSEHEYVLYTPSITETTGDFAEVVEKPNVKSVEPKGLLNNILKSYWRSFGIKSQLKDDKINVFHGLSNELPGGIYGSGIHSIITIHDLIYLRKPAYYKPIDRITYEKKARYGCKMASHIIAVSEQTKRDLVELLDVAPDKISVVYQPCDPIFRKESDAEALKAVKSKFNLPDKYILTVGTIEERKNALNIVKALSEVGSDDLHLVLVGRKTKYFDLINAECKKTEIEELIKS